MVAIVYHFQGGLGLWLRHCLLVWSIMIRGFEAADLMAYSRHSLVQLISHSALSGKFAGTWRLAVFL